MGASRLVEIFRTEEKDGTFVAAVTISYFGDTAFLSGLSGSLTISHIRELFAYLRSINIARCKYYRAKKDKVVEIEL